MDDSDETVYVSEDEYLKNISHQVEGQPHHDHHFDLHSLPYSVYRRFIELLFSGTNHFFRKTSKYNYQQCLELRGIEVGHLDSGAQEEGSGSMDLLTGRLRLELDSVPPEWTNCLVVLDSVSVDAVDDVEKLNFVKKYKTLNFVQFPDENAECFMHPDLKTVSANAFFLSGDVLSEFLDKLDVCTNLEEFELAIEDREDEEFDAFKKLLEQFYGRHKHSMKNCQLIFRAHTFKIHENVLCYCRENGEYISDFEFIKCGAHWAS